MGYLFWSFLIEPTAFYGGIVHYELMSPLESFLRGKSVVKHTWSIGVQVVVDELNPIDGRVIRFYQFLHECGVVNCRALLADLDKAPAPQRLEGEQNTTGALALIFVIVTCSPARIQLRATGVLHHNGNGERRLPNESPLGRDPTESGSRLAISHDNKMPGLGVTGTRSPPSGSQNVMNDRIGHRVRFEFPHRSAGPNALISTNHARGLYGSRGPSLSPQPADEGGFTRLHLPAPCAKSPRDLASAAQG
jgi:hypothetical protein